MDDQTNEKVEPKSWNWWNNQLKKARYQAHQAFDTLWQGDSPPMTRPQAYTWLATTLCIPRELAHMSQFSVDQCQTVIAAVANREVLNELNKPQKWGEVQNRRDKKWLKSKKHAVNKQRRSSRLY